MPEPDEKEKLQVSTEEIAAVLREILPGMLKELLPAAVADTPEIIEEVKDAVVPEVIDEVTNGGASFEEHKDDDEEEDKEKKFARRKFFTRKPNKQELEVKKFLSGQIAAIKKTEDSLIEKRTAFEFSALHQKGHVSAEQKADFNLYAKNMGVDKAVELFGKFMVKTPPVDGELGSDNSIENGVVSLSAQQAYLKKLGFVDDRIKTQLDVVDNKQGVK